MLKLLFIVCVIGAIMIAADVIYMTRSATEGVSVSYEVGFDRNYRQCDAVFPRMRESFLERVESPDESKEIAAVNFLNECLGERQPGVYVAPHMEHVLDLNYPTRALVRRKMRHQENLARSDFLSHLERARSDILDAFFQDTAVSNGVPASAAKAFRLSRYECAKYGIKRLAFLKLEPRHLEGIGERPQWHCGFGRRKVPFASLN